MTDISLSPRLKTVAEMIPADKVVADIGTDHGYLPIFLVKEKRAKKVIACDVRKDPLSKAEDNAKSAGVYDHIDFRLSDGLEKIPSGEADIYVICGMGGFVIMGILETAISENKLPSGAGFILSPHSDEGEFRRFLYKNGFFIKNEKFICDNGMFYVIFSCVYDLKKREASDREYRYGAIPVKEKQPELKKFLLREKRILEETRAKLLENAAHSQNVRERLVQVEDDLKKNADALHVFEE